MDPARQKRKEEIGKALTFIQSSLAYPDPDGYKDFLTHLVCNLLDEGNAFFREGDWDQAGREFTEALNVSTYAAAEDIHVPSALLESLYVNRAAAYHSMGKYDQGVEDCDKALRVCKDSRRALYRKALCLKELGKYKEAYNCTTECLLTTRLDKRVNELAQELAVHLGLKNRKPYISTEVPAANLGNGINPLSGIAPVRFPILPHSSAPSITPDRRQPAVASLLDGLDALEDSELVGDDLDRLLDGFPNEQQRVEAVFSAPSRTTTNTHTVPSVLPAPTPQLPPAFFSSGVSQLNSLDSLASGGRNTLDALDDLSPPQSLDALDNFSPGDSGAANLGLTSTALDALDDLDTLDDLLDTAPSSDAAKKSNRSETEPCAEEKSLDDLLDELDSLETVAVPARQNGSIPKIGVNAVDQLEFLDALDSFPSSGGGGAALPAVSIGGMGLDSLSDFSSTDVEGSHSAATPVTRSPKNSYKEKGLSTTHEFLQACSACFPREGLGIYSFVHKPDLVHSCNKDILLCRRKAGISSEWTRVRQIPAWNNFTGPIVLCRNLLESGDAGVCKYGEKCTFAFNQLEIDVWTEERKGMLDRNLLFDTAAVKLDPVNSIIRLLQEHKGMFMFLCQECYDRKPRMISKRCKENYAVCSNVEFRHNFDANKCMVFIVRTINVNYRKVRPLSTLCHLDLCRQAIRDCCQREDSCYFAHSVIELQTWRVQKETGISPNEIVKISTKYHENPSKPKVNRLSAGGSGGNKPRAGGGGVEKNLNMKMKLACVTCWRDGLLSEPDKTHKYCNAKARHTWTKERQVLLVRSMERSKWVMVRSLPRAKTLPVQFDICAQILEKRKCSFVGNCTFAHSQEEKEVWTYMKNNNLRDTQQTFDMWLTVTAQNRQADGSVLTQPVPEEKYIVMPTDYAEQMSGFHCRLCGKHSNSERQWQQHISTEKHKDRVFSCEGEDEALTWSYRFPGTRFQLCSKLDDGCPDSVSCDFAHSPEELQEWTERRDFLRQKLAKAREDMLIMPDELDFGKYNFLLQD